MTSADDMPPSGWRKSSQSGNGPDCVEVLLTWSQSNKSQRVSECLEDPGSQPNGPSDGAPIPSPPGTAMTYGL